MPGFANHGFANKTLWAVDMSDQAEEDRLFNHARAIGAGAVAIRTTSARLPASMKRFQDNGMQVYAWRWPAVVQHDKGRYAIDEAHFVAQTLIPAGLDGYIVDPESEGDRAYNDWDRTDNIPVSVKDLAISFCKIVRDGAQAAGKPDFLLGLTSGGNYPATLHHLPWQQFVAASDALFPQLYWRARDNNNICKKVRDGTPDTAFDACLPSWRGIASGKPIIPIAGEISCVLDLTELAAFARRTAAEGLAEMHFYADDGAVTPALCAAIKNL